MVVFAGLIFFFFFFVYFGKKTKANLSPAPSCFFFNFLLGASGFKHLWQWLSGVVLNKGRIQKTLYPERRGKEREDGEDTARQSCMFWGAPTWSWVTQPRVRKPQGSKHKRTFWSFMYIQETIMENLISPNTVLNTGRNSKTRIIKDPISLGATG